MDTSNLFQNVFVESISLTASKAIKVIERLQSLFGIRSSVCISVGRCLLRTVLKSFIDLEVGGRSPLLLTLHGL